MRLINALSGFVLGMVATCTQAETPVDLRYAVSLGPLPLADFQAELLDLDTLQSVQVQFASRGVATWWSDAAGSLEVLAVSDAMRTLSGFGQWGDYSSQVDVVWSDASSAPEVQLMRSRPPKHPLTPVPPDSLAGTVDPFAPVFVLGRQLAAGQPCQGSFRVFDGIRRYDVIVQDGGTHVISEDAQFFGGSARVCEVTVERLGGFSERRGLFRFGEAEIQRRLYFAEVQGGWWPVRFEITSPLGDAVARLRVSEGSNQVAQSD